MGSLERGMVGLGDGGATGPGRGEGSAVVGALVGLDVLGGRVKGGVGLTVGPSLGCVGAGLGATKQYFP